MKISVVIAVYNGNWCIERALDSILAQTRPADEIIVCDDGSTDNTADLVEERYAGRVKLLRFPHRNATACRSDGLDVAQGDWFAFMDADDVWKPEKLEKQIAFLERNPGVKWIGSDGELFGRDGVIMESWFSQYFDRVEDRTDDILLPLIQRCFPLLSSMMVHADAYRAIGGLDLDIHRAYDYDLWVRLADRFPSAFLADRLIGYWTGPGTLSRDYEVRNRQDLMVLRKAADGVSTRNPKARRRAADRVASIAFDLAVKCMRARRYGEARAHLRDALHGGPLSRRIIALGGSLAPDMLMRRVLHSSSIKSRVRDAREQPAKLDSPGGAT